MSAVRTGEAVHRADRRDQIAAKIGKCVVHPRRMRGRHGSGDETVALESAQGGREHFLRHAADLAAIEHLRTIAVELQAALARTAVHPPFDVYLKVLREGARLGDVGFLADSGNAMLDDFAWWARVLTAARTADAAFGKAA